MQESERESAQLSENVRQGQAEVEELRGALQAAAAKSKEQETLVADLTHVLQQQKAHIQASTATAGCLCLSGCLLATVKLCGAHQAC